MIPSKDIPLGTSAEQPKLITTLIFPDLRSRWILFSWVRKNRTLNDGVTGCKDRLQIVKSRFRSSKVTYGRRAALAAEILLASDTFEELQPT
jgi:hypothetical protein